MKLSIQYHAGNQNLCRIPEITIRPIAACNGGPYGILRKHAEEIVRASNGYDEALAALKGMLRVCPSERNGMLLAEYEAARAVIAKAEAA